jgi:hypothetical protein
MNIQEAKFILGVFRPDGRDAGDPKLAEALAMAGRDPELRVWLERQQAWDRAVAEKIQAIPPPPGLRDAIIAGARASRPRPRWWLRPFPLAAAAAIVVLGVWSSLTRPGSGRLSGSELVAAALNDRTDQYDDHVGFPEGLEGLQSQLASAPLPLTTGVNLDLEELRQKRCRSVKVGGREMFEICFKRDGVWFHLYAARRSDFAPGAWDARSLLTDKGGFAATAWADSKNVYALVVHEAPALLRQLL